MSFLVPKQCIDVSFLENSLFVVWQIFHRDETTQRRTRNIHGMNVNFSQLSTRAVSFVRSLPLPPRHKRATEIARCQVTKVIGCDRRTA